MSAQTLYCYGGLRSWSSGLVFGLGLFFRAWFSGFFFGLGLFFLGLRVFKFSIKRKSCGQVWCSGALDLWTSTGYGFDTLKEQSRPWCAVLNRSTPFITKCSTRQPFSTVLKSHSFSHLPTCHGLSTVLVQASTVEC